MHFKPRCFVAVLLVPFASCREAVSPRQPTYHLSANPLTSVLSTSEKNVEAASRDRYALSVTLESDFKPGSSVRITVQGNANYATESTLIRLALPEVRLASSAGWKRAPVPIRQRIEPYQEMVASLRTGQTFQVSEVIQIPLRGVYRAVVTVQQLSSEARSDRGTRVLGERYEEKWFVIAPQNGGLRASWVAANASLGRVKSLVTGPQYDDADLPAQRESDGEQSEDIGLIDNTGDSASNQLLLEDGGEVAVPVASNESAEEAFLPAIEDGAYHTIGYYAVDSAKMIPLPSVFYTLKLRDPVTWEESTLGGGSTDGDGKLWIPCPSPIDHEVVVYARLQDNDVYVPLASEPYGVDYETSSSCTNQNPGTIGLTGEPARIYENAMHVIAASRSFFGYSRGSIEIDFVASNGTPFYSSANDDITIYQNRVWYDDGRFTVGHEYGHAVDYAAWGRDFASSCPSPHYFDEPNNLQCAFGEGVADYHSYAVWGSTIFHTSYYGEQNNAYQPNTYPDGSMYEGPVSGFLYDLTDAANETRDSLAFSGNYVATLLRDCRVTDNVLGSHRVRGVDEFVQCLEGAPLNIYGYFLHRTRWPSAVAANVSTPSGWSLNKVRVLWKWDLYGVPSASPPTVTVQFDGYSSIKPNVSCTWFANVNGGSGAYSYSWRVNGELVSEDDQFQYQNGGSSFTLALEALDTGNYGGGATQSITVTSQAGDCNVY